MPEHPSDWPASGAIDLALHDRPHRSSTTEWWYVNAHLTTRTGRRLALFASFFRIATGRDPKTHEPVHAHSVTWALTDLDRGRYFQSSLVDPDAPRLGLERLERDTHRDARLKRALAEVLRQNRVPHPDRLLARPAFVATDRLALEFDDQRFARRDDGSYALHLANERERLSCELVFTPRTAPVRHGDDGVVRGADGADMFYVFVPRCDVAGRITFADGDDAIVEGSGWYDHEFGRHLATPAEGAKARDVAWNWVAAQLADGRSVTGYALTFVDTGESAGSWAVVVEPDGRVTNHKEFKLEPRASEEPFRSARTFHEYPVRWRFEVPGAGLELDVDAAVDDQEFISVVSPPAFWEGRANVTGRSNDREVAGVAFVERSGFSDIASLDQFFAAVGGRVRRSVRELLPFEPTFEELRGLVARPGREELLDGVDPAQFVRTMVKPIREITDRGGKSWRSYAALACCDVVGGDSREFVKWLAMPEFLHVGSLIVDDVEDRSTVRRGGPASHVVYGEPLAINAGTACYFLGQQLLVSPRLSSADRLRLYDLYFDALRAGHTGQALDLEGHDAVMNDVVLRGSAVDLERRVLAVHRLKTAAPAGALARMGAVAGGGSDAQVDALGRFFESVGLAFQIVDDVLNLRGFKGDLKSRGEDVRHGKVTLPVAKAFARLDLAARRRLWDAVRSKTDDAAVVDDVIATLEKCGALDDCSREATELVDSAWRVLDVHLEPSLPKLMLRAFGWYVLERHY